MPLPWPLTRGHSPVATHPGIVMNKAIWGAAVVFLAALVCIGCDQQRSNPGSLMAPGQTAAQATTAPQGGVLKLPEGTKFRDVSGPDGSSIVFTLPEAFRLVGRKADGSAALVPEAEIKCKCLRGRGTCSPFRACQLGSCAVGCVLDGCSECHATVSLTTGEELSEVTVLDGRAEWPEVVLTYEEAAALACPTAAAFERPEVRAVLERHARHRYREADEARLRAATTLADLPGGYTMAPVNVMGMLLWLPVPRENTSPSVLLSELMRARYDENGHDRVTWASEEGGGGSCRCAEGAGACAHKRQGIPGIGVAEWCEARGCSACALRY